MKLLSVCSLAFGILLPGVPGFAQDNGCGFIRGLESNGRITCSRIKVPEDHSNTVGRKVKIAYAVISEVTAVCHARRAEP